MKEKPTLTGQLDNILVEQRAKIDTRTAILRFSIGLNAGLLAGLIVHFMMNCR